MKKTYEIFRNNEITGYRSNDVPKLMKKLTELILQEDNQGRVNNGNFEIREVEEKELDFESIIKNSLIKELDELYKSFVRNDKFVGLIFNKERALTTQEVAEITSILMAYRNIIAGTEWDGVLQEYKMYRVKGC